MPLLLKYWKKKFLNGRVYHDYYCGKGHFLIKASYFILEGLGKGHICFYQGLWQKDLVNILNNLRPGMDKLLAEGRLVMHEPAPNNDFLCRNFIVDSAESTIQTSRIVIQLHKAPHNVNLSSLVLKLREYEKYLEGKETLVLYLLNFELFIFNQWLPGAIVD